MLHEFHSKKIVINNFMSGYQTKYRKMTRKPRSHVIILIAQFLSAKQTDKKRESRRQASKLKEKKGDRDLEREIKKETFFLLEEQHENVVAAVTK